MNPYQQNAYPQQPSKLLIKIVNHNNTPLKPICPTTVVTIIRFSTYESAKYGTATNAANGVYSTSI